MTVRKNEISNEIEKKRKTKIHNKNNNNINNIISNNIKFIQVYLIPQTRTLIYITHRTRTRSPQ